MKPTLKKTKFRRKAIDDDESSCKSTEEMAKKIGFKNHFDRNISYIFKIFYHFSNFTRFLQVKIN